MAHAYNLNTQESRAEDHHELKAAWARVKPCLKIQRQTENVAHLADWLPGIYKALFQSLAPHKAKCGGICL